MRTSRMLKILGAILPLFGLCAVAFAEVKLPAVFGDHMVLQTRGAGTGLGLGRSSGKSDRQHGRPVEDGHRHQ